MKNLKVWLVILPLFTVACSNDFNDVDEENPKVTITKKIMVTPDNPLNPYDYAGRIHNDILDSFEELNIDTVSADDVVFIIDTIAAAHPETPYSMDSLNELTGDIAWIVGDDSALDVVLASSSLSSAAQLSLSGFIYSLLAIDDEPYEDIYATIVLFESSVLANLNFTTEEKRIILTSMSIARYSVHRKKRKDKDWETSVGNYAGAVYGAEEDGFLGLKIAAAVGIYQNFTITK